MATLRVIVASTNPVKINSVKIGFEQLLPHIQCTFTGMSVPSGVRDQPMTEAETLQGALNRISEIKKLEPDADFHIGIEGGLEERDGVLEVFAWIVAEGRGVLSKAKTATFSLPHELSDLVLAGKELGHASDTYFGTENSKHDQGAVGLLTNGVIDRTEYYRHPVLLALIPFVKEMSNRS